MSSPAVPTATATATPRPHRELTEHDEQDDSYDEHRQPRDSGLIRRSWHAMTDVMSPFSSKALASLPKKVKWTDRYARADAIPDVAEDEDGERPTVRDYHAINGLPPNVRIPKKIKTTVKVEPKIWFANERTWVSYLDIAILIGTLALALFNTAKDDITRYFAYAYAVISVGIIVYGYALYQRRISLIRARDPDHFDQIMGPVLISVILFSVVLINFIVRVRELNKGGKTIPNVMAAAFALKST